MAASPAGSRPIQAMIFDAGDVLYHRPRRYQKLAAFLGSQGIDASIIVGEDVKLLEQQAFKGLISRDQYREALLRLYGIVQPCQIEKGKLVLNEEDNDIEFFDGVREALQALKKKGCLLGIITDTAVPISEKLNWFERGGFAEVWDSIISSKEVGIRKPDPRIFQAALKQLGVSASRAVFVGHKKTELDGARAIGMKTAAYNYETDASADYYIGKLADLLDLQAVGAPSSVGCE
jgi:HAD superfamily hydrolase (TIGR01509 family)